MTEVPIEIGYRSYIRLQRKKWDIIYHSKDLYFSHANKILEPYYDMHTKEFYGIETNPTRLSIFKFIDQFHEGSGVYDTENFHDLLKHSINYTKRTKLRKPFRSGRHQQSHMSLTKESREERYEDQIVKPIAREVLPKSHPYQHTLIVEQHPYEKMEGRVWTHIYVPRPVDFGVLDNSGNADNYKAWLHEACSQSHDLIVVEPIRTQFNIELVLYLFWCSKLAMKLAYGMSIMKCCREPHRCERNWMIFLGLGFAHLTLAGSLFVNPLAKYKLPDQFHDTEALNELKYFREFVPMILHKVKVLFKDEKGQIGKPLRTLAFLQFTNFFVLTYNHIFGSYHWYSHPLPS